MRILLFSILLFALVLGLDGILKLGLYGQKQFQGGTYLYLPLADYDKDVVRLSVSFDNGRNYTQFYIYYRQSNDLDTTTPNITRITYSSKIKYKTKHTFYFDIRIYNGTDYLIFYVPTFTNASLTTMTVKHVEYSNDGGTGRIIFWILFAFVFILVIASFIFIFYMRGRRNRVTSSQIEDKGPTIPSGPIYPTQPSYPAQPSYPTQPSYPEQPIYEQQPGYQNAY